ncbi:RagB/SusD family nutrient uptake outer membrane protein [Maribacter ulvicola]|uniref:Starch-binding associating with outer membrane n=1 Tax=Maribacter ulvicola TaxID=228959 RepID=A0A1N6ZXK8_9FLAO|nr:RagB/SusD family nutrient uptake outer membrane protein [Maribacter ulvicola]SIR31545.1 Starch-binding associating with outer membrane [Maribacter ulvicola]
MKSKIIIFKTLLLIGLALSSSCEQDLGDNFAQTELTEATFFKTSNDFKLYSNNYYGSLPAHGLWGREDWSDLTTSVNGNVISRGEHVTGFNSGVWDNSYALIRSTSTLIEKIEEADSELRSSIGQYKGESHFFRGMAYFNLLRQFGGVPLIDHTLSIDSQELNAPRNSREEIVAFIISELKLATDHLLLKDELGGDDNGRVTKGAAFAFLSRVALFEGTWQKYHGGSDSQRLLQEAITASEQVMNDTYELFDRRDVLGDDNYKYLFTLDKKQANPANLTKSDNNEFILSARRDLDEKPHNSRPDPVNGLNPTKKLVDMFLCTDGLPVESSPLFKGKSKIDSEYENRDSRMLMSVPLTVYYNSQQAAWTRNWSDLNDPTRGTLNLVEIPGRTATGYITLKFMLENEQPNGSDYPVIRLAEVLLNFAEATYELNGSISDGDLDKSVNQLRERVGLPSLTNAFVAENGLNMLNEIRRERAVELFAEGFRYDDLRRWKTAETELPKPMLGIKYGGTEWETHENWASLTPNLDAEGFIIVDPASNRRFDPKKHYLFPLPLRQLQLNDELEQNPGW